jgi:hypothetical protein
LTLRSCSISSWHNDHLLSYSGPPPLRRRLCGPRI